MTEVSYTDLQLAATSGVSETVSALSFLGSAFVLLCYARYKALRKWSFTLVACLAATDILNQIFDFLSPSMADIESMLPPGAPLTPRCWAQALGNGVFELASVFWTGTIAYTLYRLVWLRDRLDVVEATLPRLCAFAFGVPLALTLLPFLQGAHVFGPSGGHATWCWIRPAYPWWVFICFYIPLWLTMGFNAFVHLRTLARLRGIRAGGVAAAAEEGGAMDAATAARFQLIMQRLNWYPFILLIVWGPASINRVLEAVTGGRDSFFPLYFLQRVFSSSQGLLNAVAYGLTRGIREAVYKDVKLFLPRSWVSGGGSGGGGGGGAAGGSGGSDALESKPPGTLLREAQSVDVGQISSGAGSAAAPPAVEEDDEDCAPAAPPARMNQ